MFLVVVDMCPVVADIAVAVAVGMGLTLLSLELDSEMGQ